MGRSLGTDVRDTAPRPGGGGAARGSRVLLVLGALTLTVSGRLARARGTAQALRVGETAGG